MYSCKTHSVGDALLNDKHVDDIVTKDTGVEIHSDALLGKRVLLAITGGIAAVESIRLARELRRHQADLTVIMSHEATKIITPLAVSWGSDTIVNEGWSGEMSQLEKFDIVLIAPATRNTISKHIHGIMDSPIMMALSASRGRGAKLCFVPSMHTDLFDDPVTSNHLQLLNKEGSHVILNNIDEGKLNQPDSVSIVAEVCHITNSASQSKTVAITLGANRAPIDAVRAIQNASSGRTGWIIAEYLHRMGHKVICIAGKTSAPPSFNLPEIRRDGTPDGMLELCRETAENESPEVWIHAAAVLDYYSEAEDGKKPSGADNWQIDLSPGPKHIAELSDLVTESIRIGFKLESSVDVDTLLQRARNQIERYGVDAVVANIMEEMNDPEKIRARIVHSNGQVEEIQDDSSLTKAIHRIISTD